jgi:hypothetical protein
VRPRDASTVAGRTSRIYAPSPPPPSRAQALLARADKLLAEQHLKLQASSRAAAADASASPPNEVNRPLCAATLTNVVLLRAQYQAGPQRCSEGVEVHAAVENLLGRKRKALALFWNPCAMRAALVSARR